MFDDITPLILTLNEAPNISRTLAQLLWARRIVVVDSGSTDGTLEILRDYAQVEVIYRQFTDFKSQWNFGLSHVATPWALSLDADYELTDELVRELKALVPAPETLGYRSEFIYRVYGHCLRGSLYPPRVVLFRKGSARYRQEGHTQMLIVDGLVLPLHGRIYHDDRKPLSRWIASQQRYARDEADHLLTTRHELLSRVDRIRLMAWPAPIGAFLYALILKRGLLDGWAGCYYALQRATAEALIALELLERRFSRNPCTPGCERQ